MATYTPEGDAANWLANVYAAELDTLAYERAVLWPQIRQLPPPKDQIHLPRFDTLTSVVISETLTHDPGLSFVSNTETKFTASAKTRVTPIQISLPTIVRMMMDPMDEFRQALEKSVASGIDTDVLAHASLFTTNQVGDPAANLDFGTLAEAHQKMVTSGKEYFEPREKSKAIAVVAATQDDDLISITQITQAQIRGDRLNPLVGGWVATALGVDFYESTNVQVSGTQANNVMLLPRALGIGFNQRPTALLQDFQIWKRLIVWSDYASGAVREQYGVLMKSIST